MEENTVPESKSESDAPEYLVMLFLAQSKLQEAKPNDRGRRDRAFAVALTDLEKLIAYVSLYCQ